MADEERPTGKTPEESEESKDATPQAGGAGGEGGGGDERPPNGPREENNGEGEVPGRDDEERSVRTRREEQEEKLEEVLTLKGLQEHELEQMKMLLERHMNIPSSFIPTKEHAEILIALYSPRNFVEFIEKVASEVRENTQGVNLSVEQFHKRTSEKVELKIALFFDNLFSNLDVSNPKKTYDEVAQKDPFYNFQVAFDRLERSLAILAEGLQRSKDEKVLEVMKKMTFWKQGEVRKDEERRYGEDGNEKIIVVDKIRPLAQRVKAENLSDFVIYLKVLAGHEQDTREYAHNTQAIFSRPAGEDGFYRTMAGYVEQMRTADVDQFLALPDHELLTEAISLHHKILEKEFAKSDWRHYQNQFDLYFSYYNKMETQTLKRLKELHKDVEDWRLRRAMRLTIGAGLGIFMNEVEMAASADPVLSPEGGFSFTSYYRNDSAALGPLNTFPHDFWRWQQEGTLIADLLFLPVKGGSLPRIWDHTQVFRQLEQYKADFEDRKLTLLPDGRVRLIDIMNPSRMGGVVTRAGWRTVHAYERWLVFEEGARAYIEGEEIKNIDKMKYLESWKAIENIGFEVLFNFATDHNVKLTNVFKNIDQRKEFFKYLYNTYIDPDGSGIGFNQYFNNIEQKAARGIKPKVPWDEKNKKFGPNDVYKFEVFRVLSHLLKNRIPTKFLRLERGRLTEGGKANRLWDSIQNELGFNITDFNMAVENVLVAETLLRKETTSKMDEWMRNQPPESDTSLNELINAQGITKDFRLTPEKLEELLRGKGISNEEIRKAKNVLSLLLHKLDDGYLEKFTIKLEERSMNSIRTDLPFSIAFDELEMRYINFRGGGGRVLARAIGEIADSEKEMQKHLKEYGELLRQTAIGEDRDMSKLIASLFETQRFIERIHGKAYSYEIAHHLAMVTIHYFKKDTAARAFGRKWFRFGKFNSLAARISGTFRGVWEWEVADIDNYIVELERQSILPKFPYDLSIPPKKETKHFLGLIPYQKEIRDAEYDYYGRKLRETSGATAKHKTLEFINKYVPLILLFIIFSQLQRAFQEEYGEKRR